MVFSAETIIRPPRRGATRGVVTARGITASGLLVGAGPLGPRPLLPNGARFFVCLRRSASPTRRTTGENRPTGNTPDPRDLGGIGNAFGGRGVCPRRGARAGAGGGCIARRARARAQWLAQRRRRSPADVVAHLLAVQAQDERAAALAEAGGSVAAVMEQLDVPRRTLSEKMTRFGIDRKRAADRPKIADTVKPVGEK